MVAYKDGKKFFIVKSRQSDVGEWVSSDALVQLIGRVYTAKPYKESGLKNVTNPPPAPVCKPPKRDTVGAEAKVWHDAFNALTKKTFNLNEVLDCCDMVVQRFKKCFLNSAE